ncbi:phage tail protein [Sphingomonas lenta]|uniref:Uncharacterized protein n=1 Tax=Sphingomonas lenta TaxID=1141887 RepID=A0A2A2SCS2_9SPHN|nr:phage tail protein [Sphingomonas lenta]PAX07013.1 hypothetical protein CKY28_13200 [Sphingomonas lenta]
MATMVLTAVGGIVAGPIGAALGAVAGSAIDARLFAPKRREGPRLQELKVQVSSYGAQIPKLFGTMRVAGTVFWATDLVERRARSGGGKGRPAATEYSYSASFAVLLSGRPIRRVGRIWADGKLLRGAAGDWKARTGFRLHLGGEDQVPDPLIASAEGDAPAARSYAYAVFEGLELADFGNRIPSLTFEVVADDGPVRVDAVARALAPELDASASAEVDGFAASGGSVRAVLEALARTGGSALAAEGGRATMRDAPARVVEVEDAGVSADGRGGRVRRSIAPADAAPRVVTIRHYDPARDWQTGLQRARYGAGGRTLELEVAAAIGAGAAKTLAERVLAREEAGRTRRIVSLGLGGLAVGPGDGVRIKGERGVWRVVAAETERWATRLELTPVERGALPKPASSGRVLGAPDLEAGRTVVEAFELPGLDGPLSAPRLMIAAAGGPGWRGAALLGSLDDGASWAEWGAAAAPAVIGRVEAPPVAASGRLMDLVSRPVVRVPEHMPLEEADDAALDAGANLALLGDELVQFGRAEPLGGGRWRLGRLLRGRLGTEDAAPAAAGARFVLVEQGAMRAVDLPAHALGRSVRVLAAGVGDADGAEASALVAGRSVLPPAPVRLRWEARADGSAMLRWIRRSRAGWRWLDGADVSLGEEREGWDVRLRFPDGSERIEACDSAEFLLGAADRLGGPVEVTVRQRGDWGLGGAARLVVPGM